MDCVFCKIISGELAASKVYEDDEVVAFMDLFPIHEGHVLVVPKQHFGTLREMPLPLAEKLLRTVVLIERSVWDSGLCCEGTNILQNNGEAAGQDVHHVHFHVVPRDEKDGFRYKYTALKPTREELDQAARMLKISLKNQSDLTKPTL
ncbi:MAG TPA: HIT domain-containing protein [Saprospiraceae bacterium]|nr:HIT domain-containing protein [Saprospiraceae bacterium]HND88554.1 HIT domain-containing protein [Saprospiraceae bacterium]HNG89374.1 HIT domain-containing protein [Saprospiraceae bacterium]